MRLIQLIINFFFFLVLVSVSADNYDCPVEKCSKNGPEIRFPFRLKGRHPQNCGYPGFDISCSQRNDTMLELPFSVKASINKTKIPYSAKFIVQQIDYMSQSIYLSNPEACLPGLLPKVLLNFSASPPFKIDYSNFTFFSCPSKRDASGLYHIHCLSNSSYNVYAVDSDAFMDEIALISCTKMFNISGYPSSLIIDKINYISPTRLESEKSFCVGCEDMLKNNGRAHDTEYFAKEQDPGGSNKKIIEGVLICLSTMWLVLFALYCIYSPKKKKEDEKKIEQFLEDYRSLRPIRYAYADLKKITDQFKEKLGQGGYGTVYKGKLSNGILVAVKILDNFKGNGEDFINEVGAIGRIHHVNVVRLVGYCADGYRRGLVYEFLPNESLEKFISSGNQSRLLGWEKLQQIAVGIAKGLDYLHQGCSQRILHFDIKPHNILLDQNFNPKVADFGLAKLCSKEQSIVSMSAARGTIGYIAPEVFSRNYGSVSCKADIYSFGMLLLDMVGGRKNFHAAAKDNSEVYFPEWMYNQLEKGEEIAIQIDNEEENKIFKKLIVAGLWCIQWYPTDRPSMKLVIQMIEGNDIPKMPPNPFASTKPSTTNPGASRSNFCNTLEIISEED